MAELEYKGYLGSAEVDPENDLLFGRLLFISDVIGYHSPTAEGAEGIKRAFHEAVDDYLASCEEEGTEPDRPCKGSFNVRVGAERHRELALIARRKGVGLNDLVCTAVDALLSQPAPYTVIHRHEHVVKLFTGQPETFTATTASSSGWGGTDDVRSTH